MYLLIKKILLVSILTLLTCTIVMAERYNPVKLPDNYTFDSINNVGTIVGLNQTTSTATPYVWRRNETTDIYDEADITPLPIDFTYNEIHVTAIGNEQNTGAGAGVIGWYLDDFNKPQSVLWYKFETAEEKFEYRITQLDPLEEKAKYCKTSGASSNFITPECMRGGIDDVRIHSSAKDCAVFNERWQFSDQFKLSPCSETSASLPICTHSMTKTKSEDQTQINENATNQINFDYAFNPLYEVDEVDKEPIACMLREHAQLSLLASKCSENDDWFYDVDNPPETIEATIVTCDRSSKVYSIDNINTILGVSFDELDNPHPVAWILTGTDGSSTPVYTTLNLGIDRVNVTSQTIKDENENRGEFEAEKSLSYDIQRRFGEAILSSASSSDAAGFIQKKVSDTRFTPFYWRKVDAAGYEPPIEILKPEKNDSGEFMPFIPDDESPGLTVVNSGSVSGWYKSNENITRPVKWGITLSKDSENRVTENLTPEFENMLEPDGEGKILHGNFNFETVGTTKVTGKDGLTSDRAFYDSLKCGIQDLNNLLITPIAESTSLLSEANKIATGRFNVITAVGIDPTSAATNNYLLVPEIVYVNLKVEIVADQSRLTVGDEHSYYITLSNNGKPDDQTKANFATCVVFIFDASVFTEELDEDSGLPKEELLAGLSFLRVDADPELGMSCKFSVIQVQCGFRKLSLEAGPVTVRILTKPRPLLADRKIRVKVRLFSTERELQSTQDDNTSSVIISVDRRGCFIATAAYGSYLAPEVAALRQFRDDFLLLSAPGRWLVETYYDVSPPYAEIISQNEQLRTISRWVLSPLVYLLLYPLQIIGGAMLLVFIGFRLKVMKRHYRR